MKKRTISAIILMALIIATFSIFAMPASADAEQIAIPVSPGQSINVDDRYCEFQITLPSNGEYDFPISVGFGGYYIIQTFGGTVANYFSILDEDETILVSSSDTARNGYANNSFIHYSLSSLDTYTLRLHGGTTPIRLSITRTKGFATNDHLPPITCFEDILDCSSLTSEYDYGNSTKVFRFTPASQGRLTITTIGTNSMEVYFMDPGSRTAFEGMVVIGEGAFTTPLLSPYKSYYVVVHQPYDDYGNVPDIPANPGADGPEIEGDEPYAILTVTIS